jgi:hypothetical protein
MQILGKIREKYNDEKFKPAVHAEIQVLEHFYKEGFKFANGDKYIGCSKPACFCCHLYIQNHPLRCIVPQSHKKVYFHWGPPLLIDGGRDKQFVTRVSNRSDLSVNGPSYPVRGSHKELPIRNGSGGASTHNIRIG